MSSLPVRHSDLVLRPEHARVLARPFHPPSRQRKAELCSLVRNLPEDEVRTYLRDVESGFGHRHIKFRELLLERFDKVRSELRLRTQAEETFTVERQLLLGAYFTHEYSLEGAALFNPSIVPHPDQAEVPPGSLRFILSLRATGEGHISSITFRTGYVDERGTVSITTRSRYCLEGTIVHEASHGKALLARRLEEHGLVGDLSRRVLENLPDPFTLHELEASVRQATRGPEERDRRDTAASNRILALVRSNFEVTFPPDTRLSERVLFPRTAAQRNGIEDARFVRFLDEDGSATFYATFTAYDGRRIVPQFLETQDFLRFRFITLSGSAVRNKGMALFPRKIRGRYAMLGRQDGGNILVGFSDHPHFWNDMVLVLKPTFPWEFVQIGNCGSPIETEAGWLVLSHGVGPMRRYCIGAFLLDKDDPTKVVGRLREPLLQPSDREREGYVPNVVYSCGCLLHGEQVVIPYAFSDSATSFATLPVAGLLAEME
jgi:predicted GH43/DUF377 family glycosyl hydrolase